MHNQSLIFTIFLFAGITFASYAQDFEFADPVKLDSSINSASEEVNPMLSQDGLRLYFVRALHEGNTGGKYAGMDIWMSEKFNGYEWSKATNNIGLLNNKDNNAVIGVKHDNQVLYLLNTYNNRRGIAFTTNYNGKWTMPEVIDIQGVPRNDFVGFYMGPEYDVLLISMKGDKSQENEDLYVSLKNNSGQWTKPINLGTTINTSGYEISPYLSDDKKRLYFASNGHGGFGDADLFVSERLYDSWTVWSKPRNLGPGINSSAFDAYLTIGADSTVMFSSNREGGLSDIYQSRIVGVEKNSQAALKESLIEEARKILADLRNGESIREHFIAFDSQSIEIPENQKTKLSNVVKDLNYQRYSRINLLSFVDENENAEVNNKRLDKIVNYLKLSGINEDKINVTSSGKMYGAEAGSAEKRKQQGVLIIISNPPN
ncbi:PD40 domain-containing protein [Fulvivirga sp. 29W222]|uniref:PD40 domain-containing protein n=1 Tax=Fulvivirga marina TaxID=2494733 RepID=A0A937FZC2_9BACT|nr:PD40 domain-containing protein [Fulvivirga marina]MBL6448915.1 PD40 domain-containing protein [Fulvivirga marina]